MKKKEKNNNLQINSNGTEKKKKAIEPKVKNKKIGK